MFGWRHDIVPSLKCGLQNVYLILEPQKTDIWKIKTTDQSNGDTVCSLENWNNNFQTDSLNKRMRLFTNVIMILNQAVSGGTDVKLRTRISCNESIVLVLFEMLPSNFIFLFIYFFYLQLIFLQFPNVKHFKY